MVLKFAHKIKNEGKISQAFWSTSGDTLVCAMNEPVSMKLYWQDKCIKPMSMLSALKTPLRSL